MKVKMVPLAMLFQVAASLRVMEDWVIRDFEGSIVPTSMVQPVRLVKPGAPFPVTTSSNQSPPFPRMRLKKVSVASGRPSESKVAVPPLR